MSYARREGPEQMLRATAAFAATSPLAMAGLVAAARMRVVEAGDYLFRYGDPSDAVYVIVEGLLEVFSQRRADDVDEPLVRLGPAQEMVKLGTTRLLDPQAAGRDLGLDTARMTADHSHSVLLSAWMAEQEAQHDYVLLVTDGSTTPWSKRCVRQADIVLLVADPRADPTPNAVERELLHCVTCTAPVPTALVLLHAAAMIAPVGTARWFEGRGPERHFHLRRGRTSDFTRMARLLTGQGVGVVLGGGGARGAAHIGVLRALRESCVPIDMIGGTSSGAGIGAMLAMGWDDAAILEANLEGFVRHNPFRWPTLPLISLFSRARMYALARRLYGDVQIEDLWTDFFCVSCNLNRGGAVVHRRGPLWKAVRATSSLPGIAAPVVQDGELLVDGGVVDNLPGVIMREVLGGTVIVVDVSHDEGMLVELDYADAPGPWRLLWSRLNPFRSSVSFPGILDVLVRTVVVSSLPARAQALADADLVLCPPVDRFGALDFGPLQEIAGSAYEYCMARLREVSLPREGV